MGAYSFFGQPAEEREAGLEQEMQRHREQVVGQLLAEFPDKVAQMRERPALIGWFVGQAMRRTGGHESPVDLCSIIADRVWRK